jgi:multidrug efflux pump subunit AcrA (membrane-fusion protein)
MTMRRRLNRFPRLAILIGLVTTSAFRLAAFDKTPAVSGTALVRLIDQANIPSEAAGVLRRVLVREGATVATGEVLGELDIEEAELTLERARLELKAAEQLAASSAATRQAETAVEESQSDLERARVEQSISRKRAQSELTLQLARAVLPVAEGEFERAVNARRTQREAVSQSEFEQLKLAVDKARIEVRQAELEREINQLVSTARDHEVTGLRASVNRRQAALDLAREEHSQAQIVTKLRSNAVASAEREVRRRQLRSPLSGILVRREIQPGEWVAPGIPVFRVVNLDRLRVETFFPLAQSTSLEVGTEVEFLHPEGAADRRGPRGTIEFISPEVDPVTSQVLVWAVFDNTRDGIRLRPGQRGALRVVVPSRGTDGARTP